MAFSPMFSCFLLCALVSTATAFDITKILNQYTDYAAFNQELSKTGVAEEINERKAVTVLVVKDDVMSQITSQKEVSVADIMRIHVILDYYDSAKIKALTDETTLTTLYQTTGSAYKEQGFITVSKEHNEIKLGSAISDPQMTAKVNKVVTSVPYDISVIEISSPIIPVDVESSDAPSDSSNPPSESSPSPPPSVSSPSPPPSVSSPSSSPNQSPSSSPAGSSSGITAAPVPAPSQNQKYKNGDAPALSPSDANAPSSDDADADDDGDDVAADAPSDDDKSSSSRNAIVSGVMLLASFVATL
ncbi:hypothetical protein L2E82_30965 [Cichorium intybus]|uniref:Uncharacterized protein n=1 Tax=Cichorium intybus TaxID=13427 RepID=A0ACB9D1X1_CICIN|nr:hypothetical protein L2E82_30965 [Cichorium intybus]